jgi:rod shape-determining protein MreB
MEVRGRDQLEGLPKTLVLTSTDVTEAISETVLSIVGNARAVLEQTPPELAADIADRGMLLTGGGALLRNLDVLFSREAGIPAFVADDPLSCVAIGAGRALEKLNYFKDALTSA